MLLSSRLEIQSYYFIHAPLAPGPTFPQNATRAFNTSHALITTLRALASPAPESTISNGDSGLFLRHAPHNVFRSAVDAASLLLSALTSSVPPPRLPAAPDTIARHARDVVAAFSVKDGDLPHRAHALLDAYWARRSAVPRCATPAPAWPNRLAAGTTYGCLQRFNRALADMKKAGETSEAMHRKFPPLPLPNSPYPKNVHLAKGNPGQRVIR